MREAFTVPGIATGPGDRLKIPRIEILKSDGSGPRPFTRADGFSDWLVPVRLVSRLHCQHPLAESPGPTGHASLLAALDGEAVGFNVLRDH